YDDDHYKKWPSPITEQEIKDQCYLKSLSTREELSVFLSIRGACLTEAGRLPEATATFEAAYRFAPNWEANQRMLAEARERLATRWRRKVDPAPARTAADVLLRQAELSRRAGPYIGP